MPKSRRRKPRSQVHGRRRPSLPPELGQMLGPMLEADEHEIRGDAAGALRVIERMPVDSRGKPFWRPERVRRLKQLVSLGDEAPAWVGARWVVAQAAQSTPGDPRRAIGLAVETRGGPDTLWGVDEIDEDAKVIDHDWVYRQLVLYEYGGLATFVRRRATRALLFRAEGVEAWASARMGAYELVAEAADRLTWREVGSDRLVETLNLGGAVLCPPGEHTIGRVVAAGGACLFENPPLCVPPDVAEAVAASPADWIGAVNRGIQGPFGAVMGLVVAKLHRFDLVSDAPIHLRQGPQSDVSLVLAALAGDLDLETTDVDLAPLVAAALVEPGTAEALGGLLVPSDGAALDRLGGVLAPPSGVICQRLAAALSDAA